MRRFDCMNNSLILDISNVCFFKTCLLIFFLILSLNVPKVQAEDWLYTVHAEDTLWSISERFLINGSSYASRLQTHNKITDADKISPGSRIKIPVSWLKQQPAPVVVIKVQGKCSAYSSAKGTYDLLPGMNLHADDVIITEKKANVTLEFADGSRLLIQEKTELVLDTVSAYGKTGMVDTRLNLRKGNVETQVKPTTGAGSRYEIITPSAIAAVRGTDFRVNADTVSDSMRSEVLKGLVQISAQGTAQSLPEGFGLFVKRGEKPGEPIKLLPAIDLGNMPEVLKYLPLKLNWSGLAGAKQYRLQIAPNNLFEQLLVETVVDKPEASIQYLANGQYSLRLRGIDALGMEGKNAIRLISVLVQPQPPTPLKPKNMASVYQQRPEISWSKPTHVISYHFQLSNDESFSELLIDQPNYQENSIIPAQPLARGVYYWRVSSLDVGGNEGPYCLQQIFSIKAKKMLAPKVFTPNVEGGQIHFQWQATPEAIKYQFQLSVSESFDELIVNKETTQNELTHSTGDLSGNYFFRISSINADGEPGPFSAVQEVEITNSMLPYWFLLLLFVLIIVLLRLMWL